MSALHIFVCNSGQMCLQPRGVTIYNDACDLFANLLRRFEQKVEDDALGMVAKKRKKVNVVVDTLTMLI